MLEQPRAAPELTRTAVPTPPDLPVAAPVRPPRFASVDTLRGLVMVLMALDHTRDFFGPSGMSPRDVADPALFLTRWITHFCAPVFILLAGVSAFLHGDRDGGGPGPLSRFLLVRGLWLVLMEFTLVRVGWSFDIGGTFFVAQVIWAIGTSMIVLAGLVHLPRAALAAIGLALIGGHNLLDGIRAEDFGAAGWVWTVLHEPKVLRPGPDVAVLALYPLVPWIGVMATGYALGPLFRADSETRRRRLVRLGLGATAGFIVLRALNAYGDPAPWRPQDTAFATVLSFLNCEKYPPSLLYLLMTLGPGLLLLAAFERARGRAAGFLQIFGRVPFFFYLSHLYLIHALAVAFALATVGDAGWLFGGGSAGRPPGYGLGMAGVYGATAVVVVLHYPLCRRFAELKRTRPGWWWSYL